MSKTQTSKLSKPIGIVIVLLVSVLIWIGIRVALPDSPTFFAGATPTNLGIKDNQLAPCPTTPNCVSSQSQDDQHSIQPIAVTSTPEATLGQIKQIIESQPRTKIIAATDDYIYAQFSSRWLGFVDDVEFAANPDGAIDVRSASRLGESDLGVNRQRIETIRQLLASKTAMPDYSESQL